MVELLGTRTRRELAKYYVIGVLEVGESSCVRYTASRGVLCHIVHVVMQAIRV